MDILCATDDCFAPYCGIMLTSLFENNKNHQCRVFIIVSQPLKRKNTRRFTKLGKTYGQQLSFIIIDDSFLHEFPKLRNSLVTYYRLFAEGLLPKSINKVLYLDADIIVNTDLFQLWDIDLTDQAIAVVEEIDSRVKRHPEELHYPMESGYFNAGVILMNLDYWRKNGVSQQCLSFLENRYNTFMFHDQDVLNAVLWDKKIALPLSYNFLTYYLEKSFFNKENPKGQEAILKASNAPCIIHFAGSLKPWATMYYRKPFYRVWKSYQKKSPWPIILPTLPKRKPLNWAIKRYLLWPIGLMKDNTEYIISDNK